MTQNVLVLGIGNLLLGDEGVGVRIVEAFEKSYRLPEGVTVLDGGTSGMDLLNYFIGVDYLIVADAVRTGAGPAELVELRGDDVPAVLKNKMSPHQVTLADVLASAQLTGKAPTGITIVGVEPVDMELGLDLSPGVSAQVAPAVERIADELRRLGFEMEPA